MLGESGLGVASAFGSLSISFAVVAIMNLGPLSDIYYPLPLGSLEKAKGVKASRCGHGCRWAGTSGEAWPFYLSHS